jgi:hypothetical protein
MSGGDNSLGYLRQINEKMDRLLSIAERYVGVPTEPAAEPAASAEEVLAAEPAAVPKIRKLLTQEHKEALQARRQNKKAEKEAAAAEPAAEPASAAAAAGAEAAAPKPRIPIVVNTAQAYARMLRRTLEKGVADPSAKAKLEKDLRDLQPKINAEIAAGIPLESEFQSQYDAAVLYLTREGLKPEMRLKMERIRNDWKAKLNAEKEHGIARGGSKKRKTRKR